MKKLKIDWLNMLLVGSFVILAAICKALIDTIAFHRGGVFKGIDFFDINKQGKMFPLTSYPFDMFHLLNSTMLLSFLLGMVLFKQCAAGWKEKILILFIFGAASIMVFNLFWTHIFN